VGDLLEATLVKKDKPEVSVQLSTNPVFSKVAAQLLCTGEFTAASVF